MSHGDGEKLFGRLIAYLPDGPRLGPLSHPVSWQVSVPFNDVGSLEMVYHRDSPNYDFLTLYGGEVALELRWIDDTAWFEPPGCRFLNLRRHEDNATRTEADRFSMPNYAWLLRKVRQIDLSTFNADGVRPYSIDTPTKMMKDILTEAQARSNIPGLDHSSFSALIASDGAAWISPVTMNFEMGQDALSMMDAFARQRLIDWNFQARSLRIYNPNTFLTQDKSQTIKLFDGYEVLTSPMDFTYEDMATRLLQQGDSGVVVVETDLKPFSPWGAWEEAATASGVSNPAELSRLAQNDLQSKYDYKTEYTKELIIRENTPRPLMDFFPGQLVTTNQSTAARVQQITLIGDGSRLTVRGSLVLSNHPDVNRMVPRELRQQRWINSLVGGAGVGGPTAAGGNGMLNMVRVAPTPPAPSTPTPAIVLGVSGTSASFNDTLGRPQAQLQVNWTAVTLDTSGAFLTPSYYQIVAWSAALPSERPIILEVSSPVVTGKVIVPEPGTYSFVVRAVSQQGVTGSYSATSSTAVTYPAPALPTPSLPQVISRSNQVRVVWDGLDSTAATVPAHIEFCCVERSLTGPASGFITLGTIAQWGASNDGRINDTLDAGLSVWYRMRFRDRAGNFGPYTAAVFLTSSGPTLTSNSVPGTVIQTGTLTGTQMAAYTVHDINLAHGRGSERNLVRDPSFSTGLNAFRLTVSNLVANTNPRCLWQVATPAGSGMMTQLGAGGEYDARLILVHNDKWMDATPSSTTQPLPDLDYGFQVDPDYGPLRGGFRFTAVADTWPAAGQGITLQQIVRFYGYNGANLGGVAVILTNLANVNANTAPPFVVVKTPTAGITVPADAAFALSYVKIASTGMTGRTGVQVTINRPFLMQSYSAL